MQSIFQVVELKDSSAFSAAFILRALAEDLELFKEHDFTFLVEGEKPTFSSFSYELLFRTAKASTESHLRLP